MSAILNISRKTGFTAIARKIQIYVDGASVGRVKEGKTLSVPIEPGNHVVHARMDWWHAAPASIFVQPEGTVSYQLLMADVGDPTLAIKVMIPFFKCDAFELRPLGPLPPPVTPYPR